MIIIRRIREVLSINPVAGGPGPSSVTEDNLAPGPGPRFPYLRDSDLVPCDVLPIWHLPDRCPTTFLCPTPRRPSEEQQ